MENEKVRKSGQNQRLDSRKFFTSFGLSALRELLGLSSEPNCEAILAAIDFGNLENLKNDLGLNKDSEVGLALLDTKDLGTLSIPSTKLISTYNFVSGSTDYQSRASRRFLFGNSTNITQKSMLSSIETLISLDRRIILIGHDIKNELRTLQRLDFKFSAYDITILDTLDLAETHLGAHLGLRRLLRRLGCPAMELHCSGNDANFTLRAAILLAIQGIAEAEQSGTSERLARLTETALSPPPIYFQLRETIESLSKGDLTVVAKRRAKKLKKRIKHIEKLWATGKRRENVIHRVEKPRRGKVVLPLAPARGGSHRRKGGN